jgi:hypothetical protein
MSEMTGQSGHTLPDLKPPVCAKDGLIGGASATIFD